MPSLVIDELPLEYILIGHPICTLFLYTHPALLTTVILLLYCYSHPKFSIRGEHIRFVSFPEPTNSAYLLEPSHQNTFRDCRFIASFWVSVLRPFCISYILHLDFVTVTSCPNTLFFEGFGHKICFSHPQTSASLPSLSSA